MLHFIGFRSFLSMLTHTFILIHTQMFVLFYVLVVLNRNCLSSLFYYIIGILHKHVVLYRGHAMHSASDQKHTNTRTLFMGEYPYPSKRLSYNAFKAQGNRQNRTMQNSLSHNSTALLRITFMFIQKMDGSVANAAEHVRITEKCTHTNTQNLYTMLNAE